jgi:hypothetical protein
MKTIGIILLIVGVAMLIWKGINFQTEKKVAELGPLEVHKTEDQHIGWPAYAGGVVAVLGAVLIVAGRKNAKK